MEARTETVRLLLTYPPQRVREPVVYRLVTEYDLVPNIRKADIHPRGGGYIYLELTGERERIEQAVAWLESVGITAGAIGLDGTQEWAV